MRFFVVSASLGSVPNGANLRVIWDKIALDFPQVGRDPAH
jgi:hypothetical protein